MNEQAPIACTLGTADLKSRMAWIAEINARSLRAFKSDGLRLTLDYAPEAAADLETMVAAERACCAFLNFELADHQDYVRLTIEAPEDAREGVDQLFAPFVSTGGPVAEGSACGCGGVPAQASEVGDGSVKVAATAAVTASGAALTCGVCCVLPLMLPAAIAGAFGGVFAWFEGAYSWMTPLGVLTVAGAMALDPASKRRHPPHPAGACSGDNGDSHGFGLHRPALAPA